MIGKRGLLGSIFVLIVILFVFALTSLLAFVFWDSTNSAVQDLPNETVSQVVKDKIDEKITPWFLWGDTLFVYFFVVMLISYFVSAVTLPARSPFLFLIFLALLIIATIMAMIFSNAWVYILQNPALAAGAGNFDFTTFVMQYFPIFTFVIGIIGALLFYGRRGKEGGNPEVNSVDF